jgi:hypothetical protein
MASTKDTLGSSFGSSANPTPAEIYLYDIIDDVRTWINKNKRNNITGRKIKPVMQNWLKELDKVYPHLSDKNVTKGPQLQATITNIKAAIQRVLGKSDSELTFEYLAQYGSPDKSRQVFWNSFDTLFAGMSENLNVVKKGSSYNKKGGTGPGVFGGMRQEEEKKNRWFGGSGILRGAGSAPDQEELQNNQKLGPTSPLSSPSSAPASSSSPSSSSSGTSSKPMGFSAANDDDDDEKLVKHGDAGIIMTKDQVKQIDTNDDYQKGFLEIASYASEYLSKVLELARAAYAKILPDLKDGLRDVNSELQASRKLITNIDNVMSPMNNDLVELLAVAAAEKAFTVNGKIDSGELKKVIGSIGYIDPNTPFRVFGVNLNSDESLDRISVPNRKGGGNNRRGGGGGTYEKDTDEWNKAQSLCRDIRQAIQKNQKLFKNLSSGQNNPADIIRTIASKCIAVINKSISNADDYRVIQAFSNSPKDFNGMFNKINDAVNVLNGEVDKNDAEKAVDTITNTIADILKAISNPGSIQAQYMKLEPIVSRVENYEKFSQSVDGDVSAGSLIEYIRKHIITGDNDSKGIIDAYRAFSNDNGPSIKSLVPIKAIRRLVSKEMIKMLHEMESYWD